MRDCIEESFPQIALRALATLASCLILLSCSLVQPPGAPLSAKGGPQRSTLNGQWLFLPDVPRGDIHPENPPAGSWYPIQVPANWYLEGYDFAGTGIYRLEFTAPESGGDVYRLRFEAVDYFAEVWLNGARVGRHTGYFQPFEFDVSDVIRPGRTNRLTVKVESPLEASGESWSLHKRLIKGIFGHHDTRPGGAWSPRGQEKNSGGILGEVSLLVSKTIAINDLRVEPRIFGNGRIQAALSIRIDNSDGRNKEVSLHARLKPRNFIGTDYSFERGLTLTPGMNEIEWTLPEHDGRLWWPRELGSPALYDLLLTVSSASEEILDRKDVYFGYRDVTHDDKTGEWFINGKRYFLRGTNYISSQWLSEMNLNAYRRDIGLMERANINVVRVHAHIEASAFYQAADEAGMLVWQDFPLQWGYDDSSEFRREAVRQTADMIEMLANHPSVIAYSMHNEPPWDAGWMRHRYTDYDPEQNKDLTDAVYAEARQLESGRVIQKYSATHEHPWLGWYSGSWLDYAQPTDQTLVTEFGAQALPARDSLRRIFPESDMWPRNERQWNLWRYHNFQARETFEIAGVEPGNGVEDLIANTQLYQARLIQLAAESYRRQKYSPVGGIFQFMFVENWPSINWGVLDYWRQPKPGYLALSRAYQPVLPSIEWKKLQFEPHETVTAGLWVVNDLHKSFENASLTATLVSPDGAISDRRYPIDLPADSVRKLADWSAEGLPPGRYELVLRLRHPDGSVLGLNTFEFEVHHASP